MFLESDTHCHTIASDHAYSTILEMAQYASEKGLKAIAITDHGPAIPDGAHLWHFGNMKGLPPFIKGVRVLHGAEANITGFDGGLDLDAGNLRQLDWVIASFHRPVCAPGTPEQHTQAYLKIAENSCVDVIGHCGSEEYKFDYEKVLPVFAKAKKLVEINSHSFEARPGSRENCRKIALLCKKLNMPVVVNSDAHSCFDVGNLQNACEMLKEIDFPEELIVNRTYDGLRKWIMMRRGRDIGPF